jgi:hypothetical protein
VPVARRSPFYLPKRDFLRVYADWLTLFQEDDETARANKAGAVFFDWNAVLNKALTMKEVAG